MDSNLKNKYKLSILILTHNRPKLFNRALQSVLLNKPYDVEILVNDDSDTICDSSDYILFKHKSSNLSDIYNMLFNAASGEYIYFLEDDDYVVSDFYNKIQYKNTIYKYIPCDGIKHTEYFKDFDILTFDKFKEYYQLGQIIFKKSDCKILPKDNNIHNDLVYYYNIDNWCFINKYIYYQTTDAKDNISFSIYNTDDRFKE